MSVELTFHPFLTRVGLAKECVPAFEELKLGKKIKYIIFKLSDDKKNIEVEKSSTECDYETFIGDLPETECRYAIYDFEYDLEGGEGTR
jgi:cofilin